jgi:hypothetical protein
VGQYGINVNAICPGFFPSKMTAVLLKLGEDKLAAHAPLRRLGDDDDLKGIALLFASDAGKHITGQILAVDGGVSAMSCCARRPDPVNSAWTMMTFGVTDPWLTWTSRSSTTWASSCCASRAASRAALDLPRPEHLNSLGVAHGGA